MTESTPTDPQPKTVLSQGTSPSWQVLASRYLGEYLDKIRLATRRLPEELVWWRPHENALSVGNLILHLHGNLSLWITSGLGKRAVTRNRSKEFSADRTHEGSELLQLLSGTVTDCRALIESISDETICENLEIQGYDIDVRGAVFHAVEHMSYHTGQILYIVKALTSEHEAFDFYAQHKDE